MSREGGGKAKLSALEGELSSDVRKETRRVSRKKGAAFRGKLEALRGESISDIELGQSVFSRRK